MSKTLLLISLGPVQSVIAQAKRTRDLWMGSFLISEISKATARALSEMNAELIFPALDKGCKELMPSEDPATATNVANKIVARVEGNGEPYARAAREAAKNRLTQWGLKVMRENSELVEPDIDKTALEQLDSLLEYWAVWALLDKDYDEVRRDLESELQARKYLCPFQPWQQQREDKLKSSLDGARESVLKSTKYRTGKAWQDYRIGKREELDAIGLLKRAGGKPGQFVPVPTIGLAPWIERAAKACPRQMEKLKELCGKLPFPHVTRKTEWVNRFSFDGQIFLEDRLQPYCEEHGIKNGEFKELKQLTKSIRNELGDPHPFIACLVADGDKMGLEIEKQAKRGHEAHRMFSKRLSSFAAEARRIVESEKHQGVLVYSGGDDVLAFMSLCGAIACADALRQTFQEIVGGETTLSVGLGIGGVIESLGDLFEFGRTAEKEAKKDRNALAILVQKRGGSQRLWSCSWNDNPQEQMKNDIDLLRKGYLSTKKIYQAGDMLRKMPKPDQQGAEPWTEPLYQEWSRILSRNEGKDLPLEVFGLQKQDDYKAQYETIEQWISRLEIAHILKQAEPRSEISTQEEVK